MPWTGFVAVMSVVAAVFDVATLSLLILMIVAIISYLFADSIQRAYQESRYQALHDLITDLPNRALFSIVQSSSWLAPELAGRVVAIFFRYLGNLKVISPKIDNSFIENLSEEAVNGAIMRLIVDFAHTLGTPRLTSTRMGPTGSPQ